MSSCRVVLFSPSPQSHDRTACRPKCWQKYLQWFPDVDEAPVTSRTLLMGLPTTNKGLTTTRQSLTNDHPSRDSSTPNMACARPKWGTGPYSLHVILARNAIRGRITRLRRRGTPGQPGERPVHVGRGQESTSGSRWWSSMRCTVTVVNTITKSGKTKGHFMHFRQPACAARLLHRAFASLNTLTKPPFN
jgi:hypothetical protein